MFRKFFTLVGVFTTSVTFMAKVEAKTLFPNLVSSKPTSECRYSPLKVAADEGVTMYANTVRDNMKEVSLVRFYSETPYNLERLYSYRPGDKYSVYQPMCGVGVGNDFYTYVVGVYAGGQWLIPDGFEKVNLETNEVTVIKTKDDFTGDQSDNWPWLYEMTYDETNDICYALGCNFESDIACSNLYQVDLSSGDYELVENLDFYAQGLACDYEGNYLYTSKLVFGNGTDGTATGSEIVKIDTNRFDVTVACETKRDNAAYIPWGFQNTMEFDKTTNDLYWLSVSEAGYQNLFKVDLETGELKSYYGFGSNEIGSSLYIPFEKADSREAAARVSSLKADAPQGSVSSVALSWVNPVKQWNGEPLTELEEVLVCRGSKDNVIATLKPATVGSEMSYTDDAAEAGVMNVYYIIPCRKSGEKGVCRTVSCYAGADVPGVVGNVTVNADTDTQVTISWEKPKAGLNEGWYDESTLVYDVKCAQTGTIIAKNLAATTVTKSFKQKYNSYSFIITAKNGTGEGGKLVSDAIKIGASLDVPYVENFDRDGADSRWELDPDKNGLSYYYNSVYNAFVYRTPAAANDWTISAPINIEAGNTYRVSIATTSQQAGDNYEHSFNVAYGYGKSVEDMTNQVMTKTFTNETFDQVHNFGEDFVATKTGTYYFGINCTSSCSDVFMVKNFTVEKVENIDLAVESFVVTSPSVTAGDYSVAKVTIRNKGILAQSNYTVKIISLDSDGNEIELGQKKVENRKLNKNETFDVSVRFLPEQVGELPIAAVVEVDGDKNESNNKTSFVNVTVVENTDGSKWNVDIADEDQLFDVGCNFPLFPERVNAHSQMVYYADEIGLEEDALICQLAMEYTCGIAQAQQPDFEIYLANTEKSSFAHDNTCYEEWIDPSEMTKVYSGKITFEDGEGMFVFKFDTPFHYEAGKNLMVRFIKRGAVDTWNACHINALYNYGYSGSYSTDVYRSLECPSNMSFEEAMVKQTSANPYVPVLHLATADLSGVASITVGQSHKLVYSDGYLVLDDNALSVDVFAANGSLIASKQVPFGSSKVAVELSKGIYVVKARYADGTTVASKIAVF